MKMIEMNNDTQPITEWISTADALPGGAVPVFVCYEDASNRIKTTEAQYIESEDDWYNLSRGEYMRALGEYATYWMDIPFELPDDIIHCFQCDFCATINDKMFCKRSNSKTSSVYSCSMAKRKRKQGGGYKDDLATEEFIVEGNGLIKDLEIMQHSEFNARYTIVKKEGKIFTIIEREKQ